MTFVHQKWKHCVPACLVSILVDYQLRPATDLLAEQERIVSLYHKEFQKGLPDEGVPISGQDFLPIFRALGACSGIQEMTNHAQQKTYLLTNLLLPHPVILVSRVSPYHSVRVATVSSVGFTLMDPCLLDFTPMKTWDYLTDTDSVMQIFIR